MISVLVWNVNCRKNNPNQNNLVDAVFDIICKHNPNIIVLLEAAKFNEYKLLSMVMADGRITKKYRREIETNDKIKWISNIDKHAFSHRHDDDCNVGLVLSNKILLFSVHLPAKFQSNDLDQHIFSADVSRNIHKISKSRSIDDVVVFGDFNMNPFDPGMVSRHSFSASPDENLASRAKPLYEPAKTGYFNPMWKKYGSKQDANSEPVYGSYIYASRSATNFVWQMLDQVIYTPSLIDKVSEDELHIISGVGGTKFLQPPIGPNSLYPSIWPSDHLPLLFKIDV